MPITFDRSTCCDLNEIISREWLVTNGLGGYAAGTVAGVLTRMQHGLLVIVPPDTVQPQLLLAKLDEEIAFDQRTYYLGTNEYRDGTLSPAGFVHLESFHLEQGFPVFNYRLGGPHGILLEKRIWMLQGSNTTYIRYRVRRMPSQEETSNYARQGLASRYYDHTSGSGRDMRLSITLLPFAAQRPYNQPQYGNNAWHFLVQPQPGRELIDEDEWSPGIRSSRPRLMTGCTLQASEEARPYHILAIGHPESQVTFIPTGVWYWNFLRRHDARAGLLATDDLYLPGVFRATLWPEEDATLTLVISAEALSSPELRLHQLNLSYEQALEQQKDLLRDALQPQRYFGEGGEAAQAHHLHVLPLTTTSDPYAGGEDFLHQLLQASEHFLTWRKASADRQRKTRHGLFHTPERMPALCSGYFDLEYKTRDALIALPGLLLVTERYDEALKILRELIRHVKGGLLPDHLPVPGQRLSECDYNSADTTLWYIYALDHYLRVTHNYAFLEEAYYILTECINRYMRGTYHGIHVNSTDGLLYAGREGKALTWMDAMANGTPVTPRAGKPVELNALWYHALSLMHEWSQYFTHQSSLRYHTAFYQELLTRNRRSFQERFWYSEGGYLYDVIDGPQGNDASLRPNQLLALSLRYSVLDNQCCESIFEAVTQHLLTPYGLRSLAPHDPAYRGHAGSTREEQQRVLHQGNVWSWLIGPYIEAMLSIKLHASAAPSSDEKTLFQEYLWRKGLQLLEPFKNRFTVGLLSMNEGTFNGDAPFHPTGQYLASASCTGELLRIYDMLARMRSLPLTYTLSR
ncbi:amylo-alpha-1,6-glucosidase [Ktedonosporobacter rubrisoli]|nr:amylo-alpha-1,6-glucosidase [Ktedonosporobacter rubrisoli]